MVLVQTEPATERASLVPEWLENVAAIGWRVLVIVAVVAASLQVATVLGTVVASILVAILAAAAAAPIAIRLREGGGSRIRAAAIATLVVLIAVLGAMIVVGIVFIPYIPSIVEALDDGLATVNESLAAGSISPEVATLLEQAVTAIRDWISAGLSSLVGRVATIVTVLILAGFLTFFLFLDGDKAWAWAMQSAREWQRERLTTTGRDSLDAIGGYLRGTGAMAVTDALSTLVFLLLLGVPLAGPLAVLVFIGGFVPYLGGIVTSFVLALVTLAANGPLAAGTLLVLIAAMNVLQDRVIAPRVYDRRLRVHPALVIVALPIGAAVAGILGLAVAVPVVALISAVAGSFIEVIKPRHAETADRVVPLWLDRLAQWSWRVLIALALLVVLVQILFQAPLVALPVVLAAVLAATIAPLAKWLEGRGLDRTIASLGATIGAFGVAALILWLTIASLLGPIGAMVEEGINGAAATSGATGGTLDWLVTVAETDGAQLVSIAGELVASAAGLALVLILAILLTFFFLHDGQSGWSSVTRHLTPWRRAEIDGAGRRAVDVLGGYMLGTGVISAFGAATQFVIMALLGLPFALPLAVLSFFGGFIPYIGSFITTGLAFLVTVAVGDTTDIIVMGLFTVVFNIVQGNFVAPIVYSRVASLHPAIVLLAIPAGADIAGAIGMFLVVPFLGVVATTWRTVLRVFRDEEPTAPEAPAPTGEEATSRPPVAPTIAPAPDP